MKVGAGVFPVIDFFLGTSPSLLLPELLLLQLDSFFLVGVLDLPVTLFLLGTGVGVLFLVILFIAGVLDLFPMIF